MPVDKELKSRLSALKRSRRFVRWGESVGLARELRDLLQQIEGQVEDAQAGCTLVADFYITDHSVFGRCDDSSGHVGDVYRYDACELLGVRMPWTIFLTGNHRMKGSKKSAYITPTNIERVTTAYQLRGKPA